MAILDGKVQRMAGEQRPGQVATVCPDGTPNLSPKGTVMVWDDEHLMFADIRSPRTVSNLRSNPSIEINVVDPILRKGYRFKGTATVLSEGELFEQAVAAYRQRGSTSRIRNIVLVKVERALPLVSPAYDQGATEEEVSARWREYWAGIERDRGNKLGE